MSAFSYAYFKVLWIVLFYFGTRKLGWPQRIWTGSIILYRIETCIKYWFTHGMISLYTHNPYSLKCKSYESVGD
jgi:hypothetical protein